jgi:uncharacterized protein YndB with AHSA1/START domain
MRPDDSSTERIVREIRVAAPPAEVFRFFTEPDKMILWHATAVWLEPHPGDGFRIDVNGRNVARGEFIELDPPHRLVFSWGWEDSAELPPGASRVEITLAETGDGETLVRLVHLGIADDLRDGNAAGWDHYLPRLQLAASGRPAGADPWAAV